MTKLMVTYLVLPLIILSAIMPRVTPSSTNWLCDCNHIYYWQMAQGIQSPAPFGWRVLKPMLSRLLPVPSDLSMAMVSLWSLLILVSLTYTILRRLGIEYAYATAAILYIFSLNQLSTQNIWEIYLVDPLALVLIALAIYAAISHRFNLFVIVLAFGVMAKETAFIAIPVWAAYNKGIRRLVMAIAPAVIVFLLLWASVPPSAISISTLPGLILADRISHPDSLWQYIPFGILTVFAPITASSRSLLIRFTPMLVMVYAQLLIASDTGRLLIYGFLPVVAAGLIGLRTVINRYHLPMWSAHLLAGASFIFMLTIR